MTMQEELEILEATKNFVRQTLENAEGGHDWFHTYRVWQTAKAIALEENADLLEVELAALLHDIEDAKFNRGNDETGAIIAEKFLRGQGLPTSICSKVGNIIRNVSYKGGNVKHDHHSLELEVVQDADRLDAIGAIGIARAFNYGGFKNRKMYDPAIPPKLDMTKEEYRASTAPTINHFYEKLLRLKDGMKTKTGKRLAAERHQFMEAFLEQFYGEWGGER